MAYQMTFKRYELKYLLTKKQKEELLKEMAYHMSLDKYGRSTIRNVYLDTDNFRLIRHSIERPAYKEKLRIRSYCHVEADDPVFVELKKKYESVVYKRRLVICEKDAMQCFNNGSALPAHSQIAEEIEYFRSYYGNLRPTVFLSYEREAYYSLDGSDFRVTFDENILYRNENISLSEPVYGTPLLNDDQTLMEIKTSGGIPLWLCHTLTKLHIFKTSFSKYGSAYTDMINADLKGGLRYA